MKPLQVFLSFSPADVSPSWLKGFYKKLVASGVRIADDKSDGGPANAHRFGRAFRESDAVLFLLGKAALANPSVAFEMGAALAQEKTLIPIAAADVPKSRWPGPLRIRRSVERRSAAATAADVVAALVPSRNQMAAG